MEIRKSKKDAIVFGKRSVSYHDLVDHTESYARKLDIYAGDKIAIISENSPEWVFAFLAIWSKQGINVLIDANSEPKDLIIALASAKPKIIFASDKLKNKVIKAAKDAMIKTDVLSPKDISIRSGSTKGTLNLSQNLDEVAALLYTSGTSSKPMGVMISKRSFFYNVQKLKELGFVKHNDRMISFLPMHHSYALSLFLLMNLSNDATIIITHEKTPSKFLSVARKQKANTCIAVPLFFQAWERQIRLAMQNPIIGAIGYLAKKCNAFKKILDFILKEHMGNFRYVGSGGAPLPVDNERFLNSIGIKVVGGYGLTEAAPLVSVQLHTHKIGSSGKPICEVKIEKGEIVVKGPNVMQGYYKDPQATQKSLKGDWLYTGDLGHIDKDGFLFITGRKKEILVLPSGKKIWPQNVEQELEQLNYIEECCLKEVDGKLVVLVRISNPKNNDQRHAVEKSIKSVYNARVTRDKKISNVIFIQDHLPRTTIGKLKRFLVRMP